MTKTLLTISIILLAFVSKAQLYKADIVCVKEEDDFRTIAKVAYLNYSTKERIVELAFRDTLYSYKILQTNKPKDRHRFVVWFKKTDDNMLWNISEEGNYLFGFILNGETFWFKELTNPSEEEYQKFIEGLPKKSYN